MKDKMSVRGNNDKPQKDFIDYLHNLIEEIIINGESINRFTKWLQKYCEEYDVDYESFKSEIIDFIEIMAEYNKQSSPILKKSLVKSGSSLFLSTKKVDDLLARKKNKSKVNTTNSNNIDEKLRKKDFEQTKKDNTINAYRLFIDKYKTGTFIFSAKKALDKLNVEKEVNKKIVSETNSSYTIKKLEEKIKKSDQEFKDLKREKNNLEKEISKDSNQTQIDQKKLNELNTKLKKRTNFTTVGWIILVVVSIIIIVNLITNIDYLENEVADMAYQNNKKFQEVQLLVENNKTLMENNKTLKSNNINLQSELKTISKTYPIIIDDIKIGYANVNEKTIYDKLLYKKNIARIAPKVLFSRTENDLDNIKLEWRIILPDGEIFQDDKYISDFIGQCSDYKLEKSTEKVIELPKWGWKTAGKYQTGKSYIEIWYKGVCLKRKSFRVY